MKTFPSPSGVQEIGFTPLAYPILVRLIAQNVYTVPTVTFQGTIEQMDIGRARADIPKIFGFAPPLPSDSSHTKVQDFAGTDHWKSIDMEGKIPY